MDSLEPICDYFRSHHCYSLLITWSSSSSSSTTIASCYEIHQSSDADFSLEYLGWHSLNSHCHCLMIVFHSSLNDASAKILLRIANVCLEFMINLTRAREEELTFAMMMTKVLSMKSLFTIEVTVEQHRRCTRTCSSDPNRMIHDAFAVRLSSMWRWSKHHMFVIVTERRRNEWSHLRSMPSIRRQIARYSSRMSTHVRLMDMIDQLWKSTKSLNKILAVIHRQLSLLLAGCLDYVIKFAQCMQSRLSCALNRHDVE